MKKERKKRRILCRFPSWQEGKIQLHPLFIAIGIWYCFKGELFLFLMRCLVAIQHECAHAFAAAKLGYKLNKIVLMPFGAVIDGDLKGISLKDEITVAIYGPLCNLFTAGFFAALWWFAPTMYAFTDTACFSSLSIALVNLLPAYPLDGGRVLKCVLTRAFLKTDAQTLKAEKKAERVCRVVTLCFAVLFLGAFFSTLVAKTLNPTLLAFGVFLIVGAFGNRDKNAVYAKLDFSCKDALKKGVEIKRIAVQENYQLKDTFRFLSAGCYLVLEVYDEQERKLFELPQNELADCFLRAESPRQTIGSLKKCKKIEQKNGKIA